MVNIRCFYVEKVALAKSLGAVCGLRLGLSYEPHKQGHSRRVGWGAVCGLRLGLY